MNHVRQASPTYRVVLSFSLNFPPRHFACHVNWCAFYRKKSSSFFHNSSRRIPFRSTRKKGGKKMQRAFVHLRTTIKFTKTTKCSRFRRTRFTGFQPSGLACAKKKSDQLALRQTAPKRVRRNRGQIRRFRELDGMHE